MHAYLPTGDLSLTGDLLLSGVVQSSLMAEEFNVMSSDVAVAVLLHRPRCPASARGHTGITWPSWNCSTASSW